MEFKNPLSYYLWLRRQNGYTILGAGMSTFLTYCNGMDEVAERFASVKRYRKDRKEAGNVQAGRNN